MPRVRPHVNPLRSRFLAGIASGPIALPAGREVEVELGCAEGNWLFARAAACPEVFGVGVEIREELVEPINRRAADLPVRAVFANVNVDLPTLFAPGSVSRVFVNFPDPWFKRRQHKRRIFATRPALRAGAQDSGLLDAIARMLVPGGEIFFQSDVWALALEAMATLEDDSRFTNQAGPWSFWKQGNPYGVKSRREEACEEEGAGIWRMLYKISEPPARTIPAP